MKSINVSFDSPVDVELVAKEVIPQQESVDVAYLHTTIMENDDYCVEIRLANARVPLTKVLCNHQDELKAILDGDGAHKTKVEAIVKRALELGAGVGYNV
jgi:cytochrome c oxidase assembly protein Cox11